MTSIRAQVYAVAAADATLLALLPDGLAGLLGGPASVPPPAVNLPALYLHFTVETPYPQPVGAYVGEFEWIGEDYERAGYTRLHTILARLAELYPEARNRTVYTDADTDEDVYWLEFAGMGAEVALEQRGVLQKSARWGYRKAFRRAAAEVA